jgi:hypothetical protein
VCRSSENNADPVCTWGRQEDKGFPSPFSRGTYYMTMHGLVLEGHDEVGPDPGGSPSMWNVLLRNLEFIQ